MKLFLALLVASLSLIIMGCETPNKELPAFQQGPEVLAVSLQSNFSVVGKSELIEGSQIGGVIVKREQDGSLFAAILAPFKEINEGEQVKIWYINLQGLGTPVEFLAVE